MLEISENMIICYLDAVLAWSSCQRLSRLDSGCQHMAIILMFKRNFYARGDAPLCRRYKCGWVLIAKAVMRNNMYM